MTRYTVVWLQVAENQLAEIWLAATDRNAVTTAARRIDLDLAEDAPQKGARFVRELRRISVPPLDAIFGVSEDDRLVQVVRVRAQ